MLHTGIFAAISTRLIEYSHIDPLRSLPLLFCLRQKPQGLNRPSAVQKRLPYLLSF
jgi:hypothetical protein